MKRVGIFALMVAFALGLSAIARSLERLKASDIVGAWQLVSIEDREPDGSISTGLIIYDAEAHMSVQIMHDIHASPTQVPYEAYYAYFGTYDFDEAKVTVTHHVTGACATTIKVSA